MFIFVFFQSVIGGYTFLIFFTILLVSTILLFRYLPETRNKTFQEISAHFVRTPASAKDNYIENELYDLKGCVNDVAVKETALDEGNQQEDGSWSSHLSLTE